MALQTNQYIYDKIQYNYSLSSSYWIFDNYIYIYDAQEIPSFAAVDLGAHPNMSKVSVDLRLADTRLSSVGKSYSPSRILFLSFHSSSSYSRYCADHGINASSASIFRKSVPSCSFNTPGSFFKMYRI